MLLYDSNDQGLSFPRASIETGVLLTGYRAHRIYMRARTNTADYSDGIRMEVSGDLTSENYKVVQHIAGSTTSDLVLDFPGIPVCPAALSTEKNFGMMIGNVLFPEDSTIWKTGLFFGADHRDAVPGPLMDHRTCQHETVGPIISYRFSAAGDLVDGCRVIIIGIK